VSLQHHIAITFPYLITTNPQPRRKFSGGSLCDLPSVGYTSRRYAMANRSDIRFQREASLAKFQENCDNEEKLKEIAWNLLNYEWWAA
jgi:hypothetical protein